MRARDLSLSPLDCCRPLTFFPAPLIYLLFNPVLFLWKEFLYESTARFQSAQDSGEGKSNVEEGQGRGEGSPGKDEGSPGRKEETVVGRRSVLLQAPERMTSLVSCGSVGHWAFAESSRDNITHAAVDLCRAQTCLGGGVGAA